jgi:hypothetical protein
VRKAGGRFVQSTIGPDQRRNRKLASMNAGEAANRDLDRRSPRRSDQHFWIPCFGFYAAPVNQQHLELRLVVIQLQRNFI